jgi:cytochrome c-type biogenesis protein CcmH/NrfF
LWLGPALFLLIGAVVAVRIVLQRAKLAANQPDDEEESEIA